MLQASHSMRQGRLLMFVSPAAKIANPPRLTDPSVWERGLSGTFYTVQYKGLYHSVAGDCVWTDYVPGCESQQWLTSSDCKWASILTASSNTSGFNSWILCSRQNLPLAVKVAELVWSCLSLEFRNRFVRFFSASSVTFSHSWCWTNGPLTPQSPDWSAVGLCHRNTDISALFTRGLAFVLSGFWAGRVASPPPWLDYPGTSLNWLLVRPTPCVEHQSMAWHSSLLPVTLLGLQLLCNTSQEGVRTVEDGLVSMQGWGTLFSPSWRVC